MPIQPISQETGYSRWGVYWIRLFKNQRPFPIRRLRGEDRNGVLAIGCTSNIEKRRRQFIRSSGGKHHKSDHSEGMQLFLVRQFSNLGSGEYSIWFEYVELESKEASEREEKEKIQQYFKEYLEAPPLNGAIPGRKQWFNELRGK